MSINDALNGIQGLTNSLATGVGAIDRVASDLGLGIGRSAGTYWKDTLRPASYGGVQFYVLGSEGKFGRRNAVHEYPFRDGAWVEDMGRSARRVTVAGYIVGDDCIAQRDRLIKMCEAAGDGELVHPTLGRLVVSLLDFSSVERWDRGRVFEVNFSFIEQGKRIFPSVGTSTADGVGAAADAADTAAQLDFVSTVAGALNSGLVVAMQAISTVQGWARSAQHLVNDATNLYHFVQSLPGPFGRLFGSNTPASAKSGTSTQALISAGAVARAQVLQAASALSAAAAGLVAVTGNSVVVTAGANTGNSIGTTPNAAAAALVAYGIAAQGLAAAVASAAASPADALRLLANLGAAVPPLPATLVSPVYPVTPVFVTPTAQAVAVMAGASSDMFRRSALISLARSSAAYRPTSYDDAAAVRANVAAQLDAEIKVAGNQGQDATFIALRTLRTAIVQDLTTRGASLAPLMQVALQQTVPALVLAQRLYRDSMRTDEIISEANPIHPAFMPTKFKALAQ